MVGSLGVPVRTPEDIRRFLGKPSHLKKGYSAYELAWSWLEANGIPSPVRSVLESCDVYRGAAFDLGWFEKPVRLGTPGRDSQTDLMVYLTLSNGTGVIAAEGKVEEPYEIW